MIVSGAANQHITYWAKTGIDGYGKTSFANPEILLGRWEERTDLIVLNTGEQATSRAKVFLSKAVNVGDYLKLGASSDADPKSVSGAHEVLQIRKIPSVDGRRFEYTAYL